jgi:DNA-binding NarL/FixJ family response regulator
LTVSASSSVAVQLARRFSASSDFEPGSAVYVRMVRPVSALSSIISNARCVVAAGEALLAPSITMRLIDEFARRPPSNARPAELEALSPRELEVLRLVARGLSNAEVASELYVGDATVKTHVSRILQKLDLRDRVQAVVLAYESGLLQPGGADSVRMSVDG